MQLVIGGRRTHEFRGRHDMAWRARGFRLSSPTSRTSLGSFRPTGRQWRRSSFDHDDAGFLRKTRRICGALGWRV